MILRLSAAIPLAVNVFIAAFISIGLIEFGHIPQYGVDPDPSSTFHPLLFEIKNFLLLGLLVLLFFSPVCMIISMHYYWDKLLYREIVGLAVVYMAGLLIFFMLRDSVSFQWFFD